MIIKDNMPLSTTEKEGFRVMMKTICLYKIPGRKKITTLITQKYEALSDHTKQQFLSVKHFCLTVDIWTETLNTVSYLGFTCHFLYESKIKNVTIGVTELSDRHTADYIKIFLENICSEWNIQSNKITAVTTDNGKNIVKAVTELYGKNKHAPCFAHTLDLIVTKVVDETSGLSDVVNKVKVIVKFFKQSVVAADNLRKIQKLNSEEIFKLIQSVPTRWNSTFYMLQRFLRLRYDCCCFVEILNFPTYGVCF
nr:unnamed protein product [Callosobruchus analis]